MATRNSIRRRPVVGAPRRRQVLIAATVALSLLVVWTMLAYSGADPLKPAGNKAIQSASPVLAKEYIYAGGKLVATEQPIVLTPTFKSFAAN